MPIHITWEPHGVVQTAHGSVAALELIESLQQLQNDLRFDALHYLVQDFFAVDSVEISAAESEGLACTTVGAAYVNPHIRMAIVGASPAARTLARHSMDSSPYLCRRFDTLEPARAWIAEGDVTPVPLDIQLQAVVPDLPQGWVHRF
jgi:hypothetical protein